MFPGETVQSRKALGEDVSADPHIGPFIVMLSAGGSGFYIGTMVVACGDDACDTCNEYPWAKPFT